MHKQKVLSFLFLWLCVNFHMSSQVSVTPTLGCAPHQITYSAPPGSATWSFGDLSSPVSSPNGIHTYVTAGTYIVTYSGAAGPYTQTVVVSANNLSPSFTYTLPPSGCKPRPVVFSGTGAGSGGVYQWVFGDGGIGTGSTVTHSYSIGGVFTATLTVVSQASCAATFAAGPINVSDPANLVISANPGFVSCDAPFTTSLSAGNSISGSPLGPNLSYSWDLGNGQTSAGVSPGNTTYQQGVFTISLTATDNNNCTTSTSSLVSVVQPTVSILTASLTCVDGQNPAGPPPLPTSLPWITTFIQSSQPSVIIDLGNGSPPFNLNMINGARTFTFNYYTTPGTKTITATAYAGTCVAVAIHTMIVEEVTAQFTTTAPFFTCSPVLISNYINQSSVNTNAALTYSWSVKAYNGGLDAANSSTLTNPTFTFVQGSTNPYTIFGVYKPIVQLIARSANYCWQEKKLQLDSIARPTAWFKKDKGEGCLPLTVRLRDSSDVHSLYPMQSYTWSNGASPPVYQTGFVPPAVINPTFVYSQAGIYTPSYTISTAGGCGDVSFVDTIIVVNPPNISAFFPSSVCAGESVTFNLSSTPATSLITHWHVETDNGFFSGCISDPNPSWPFTHLGVHNVTITASDHGCTSTLTPVQTITVNGPVGKFTHRNNCLNTTTVEFYPYLQNAEDAILDFGDGQSVQLTGNANGLSTSINTHTYEGSGDFMATLTSYNSANNCQYTFTTMIHVRQLSADISFQPVVCKNITAYFESASIDEDPGCGKRYNWYVDNYPPVQTDFIGFMSDSMKTNGTHTISLLVKDINGCKSIATRTFTVTSPSPDFSFGSNPACLSDNPVVISNLTPQTPAVVDLYTLSLGTGAPRMYLNSVDWPVINDYPASIPSSTYFVKMWAIDEYGCKDSIDHVLKVNRPYPTISPFNNKTCVNSIATFVVPSGYTNTINYGDGIQVIDPAGATTYTHAFTNPGTYSVTLTISDDGGCTAVTQTTAHIEAYPTSDFVFQDALGYSNPTNRFCTPVVISCSSTSVPGPLSPIATYSWNLGNGSPIINAPVVATSFSVPGISTVTLTTLTENGCSAKSTQSLVIMSVTATPHINKTRFCIGDIVQLSLSDTTSVQYWSWNFNDGNPDKGFYALASPSPTFSYPYNYFPPPNGAAKILLYYSAGEGVFGCNGTVEIPIQIVKVQTDFKRNLELTASDYEHCVNIRDQFTNTSSVNNNYSLNGAQSLWAFGNGATSTLQSAGYTYTLPGIYQVTLTVKDLLAGCQHSSTKNMTINPLPSATISVTDSVCRSGLFSLSSLGSSDIVEYNWSPSAGVTNPHLAATTATAASSTTYSLEVINNFGCKAYSANTASIYVQQPPLTQYWDTTVIVGQNIVLNTFQGDGFTYTWSPLTDLSCSSCPYPVSTSTTNITYSVEVQDPMRCFKVNGTYTIIVDPLTTVDVPTAFTPNGDGVNDVIYVDGWGIKRLLLFRIFNRWGQVLFESTDIKVGWDGTFNGVPQNMETYIYQVSVETYVPGKNLEKTSSFKLIR